ncbi:MAG: hypothetical protein K5872_22255 [Rhizobiaceae bacterium]|nr:hypothetical protein [Rhizobiaceae bacterium]MCV0408944.1 hypothetical protein [Rhizobiaceae bacterium]
MKGMIKIGVTVGNGAALNVECGFVPDVVMLFNVTDGDLITCGLLGPYIVPFSSGGTTEIVAGDKIVGATSGAQAWVREVLEYSGTWAGGDAAGFFVVDMISGTFQSENVDVGSDTNLATVTANVVHNVAIAAAAASATGTSAISRYEGSTGSGKKGFTIGSVIAEEAKALRYIAFRGDE